MKLDVKPDAACKDISRLSFAPMQKEILYYNPSLLFAELPNAEDYPDGSLWGGATGYPLRSVSQSSTALVPLKEGQCSLDSFITNDANQKELSPFKGDERNGVERNVAEGVTSYPTDYNGIEYGVVVERLEEQLGGRPERGARNSFIFTMACNLRYICNDDAAWIASILPTYGEDAQKHRQTIQSAINRPMSREMPETLKRALGVAKACADNSQLTIHNCLRRCQRSCPSRYVCSPRGRPRR